MKQKILVTGGTGFIGSHTTVELIEAGYEVVIVDNLSNSNADVVDGIEKITGVRPAFEKVDCTTLVPPYNCKIIFQACWIVLIQEIFRHSRHHPLCRIESCWRKC